MPQRSPSRPLALRAVVLTVQVHALQTGTTRRCSFRRQNSGMDGVVRCSIDYLGIKVLIE